MKKIIALAALVIVGVVLTLTISPTSNRAEEPAIPAVSEQAQPEDASAITTPPPREPEPVGSTTPPPPDSCDQYLKTLYESPSVADRLEAAREIAARGNEVAFRDLATFVTSAEATGDETLVDVAGQVASILGQMHGDEIKTIATELAYSLSALVAEAAVNAAVAAEPGSTPQAFEAELLQSPAETEALDALVRQFWDGGENPSPRPVGVESHYE